MPPHETNAELPERRSGTDERLERALEAALDCAQSCTDGADACIADGLSSSLGQCVRRMLDCADLCEVTVSLAARRTGSNDEVTRLTLQACAIACRRCADDCARHVDAHPHLHGCAETCAACAAACLEAVGTLRRR